MNLKTVSLLLSFIFLSACLPSSGSAPQATAARHVPPDTPHVTLGT